MSAESGAPDGAGPDDKAGAGNKDQAGAAGPASLAAAIGETRQYAATAAADVAHVAATEGNAALDRGKKMLTDRVTHIAAALEASSHELRGSEAMLADRADSVAGYLRSTASHLENQDAKALAGELSAFATRHPMTFLLGAVAAGFALTRVAKATAPTGDVAAERQS